MSHNPIAFVAAALMLGWLVLILFERQPVSWQAAALLVFALFAFNLSAALGHPSMADLKRMFSQ